MFRHLPNFQSLERGRNVALAHSLCCCHALILPRLQRGIFPWRAGTQNSRFRETLLRCSSVIGLLAAWVFCLSSRVVSSVVFWLLRLSLTDGHILWLTDRLQSASAIGLEVGNFFYFLAGLMFHLNKDRSYLGLGYDDWRIWKAMLES